MEPLSMLVTAIAVGAATETGKKVVGGFVEGLSEAAKSTIVDTYDGLQGLLKRKFGGDSEVVKAAEGVQNRPDSEARKNVLLEELTRVGADKDSELVTAAQTLLDLIERQPAGQQAVQQYARGIGNAQAVTGNATSNVTIGRDVPPNIPES